MKLKYLFFTAVLGIASSAFAATPAPAASTAAHPHSGVEMCKAHADKCKADAAKFDQWCSANADKCEAFKAWAGKHVEYCSTHEKECAEHRHEMMEHMKERCEKNPDKPMCQKIKSHEAGEDNGGEDMPPPR